MNVAGLTFRVHVEVFDGVLTSDKNLFHVVISGTMPAIE